jgi:hypothetical protein
MARTYGDWSAYVEVSTLSDETALTVLDSTHGHTAETVTLTTAISLVVLDSTHGHTAEDSTVTQQGDTTLTVLDSTHAHTADNVRLISSADQVAKPAGGGIGHGGFSRKRFVKVEEAESPEEVIAAIESALSESTRKPAKRKVKVKVSPKPVETPSVNPGEWLDYYREQSRLVREQQAMQDLIARAKLKIQQLQAQETLRRLEEIQFIQQQEEEMLLLLMAA